MSFDYVAHKTAVMNNALMDQRLKSVALATALIAIAACLGSPLQAILAQEQITPPGGRKKKELVLAPRPEFSQQVRDVFFRDVRAHLGPEDSPTKPVDAAPATPTPETPASAAPSEDSPTGGLKWSELVTRDVIEDEIKAQAPLVAEAIASPSKFKSGGYRQARNSYSLLAVLFGVAAQYDGEVRFSAEAAAMRDALAKAGVNCKVGTDASLKEAKARGEDLAELIRGGSPALDEAPKAPEGGWATVSDRAPLMARLEAAQRGRLDVWTADKGEFQRQREALLREARLLTLLATVIQDPGYEYADDQQYQDYAKELANRARELVDALQQGDFSAAQSAVSRTNQSCDRCHADFRG